MAKTSSKGGGAAKGCSITKAVQKGVKGGFMPKGAVKQQAVRVKGGK